MRRLSLTTRLTLSHVLVTLGALLLLSAATVVLIGRAQRLQTMAALEAQTEVFAAFAAEVAPDTATLAAAAPALGPRFAAAPGSTVRIFAPNGSILYANADLGQFPSSAARELLTSPLPIQPVAPEGDRRFAAQTILRGANPIGVLELSQSVRRERETTRGVVAALLPGALLALGAAGLVGWMLARGLARPLHRLGRVADAIAAGETAARSADTSSDEIGQLAARINAMADELEARLGEVQRLADSRQQFYRAVSHELRTPLTSIIGIAENLDDDALPQQREALDTLQGEARRLQRLVEELLDPRHDGPEPLRRRRAVDLGALAIDAGRVMQPRAERAGIAIDVQAASELAVSGDPDRLKQALLNLLDNALSWTAPGGRVTVVARRDVDHAVLLVRDTGVGIAPELRERVWERGFSANGGQGIGLALVREIAEAHGGSAAMLDERGAAIELRLPIEQRGA